MLVAIVIASGAWAQVSPYAGKSGDVESAEQDVGTHIFGIVPNHNTLPSLSIVAPLRAGGKFRIAQADSFDQCAFILAGIYGGIGQWQHQYPEFGLGTAGFAKRYATAYADQVIGNFMIEAIFPIMLHQDPRYYRMVHGGFLERATYAVSRVFITRSDTGAAQFNFSQVAGTATGAAIANIYYPDRTFSSTMQRTGIQLASGGVFNVLKEFWPEIREKVFSRRRTDAGKNSHQSGDPARATSPLPPPS